VTPLLAAACGAGAVLALLHRPRRPDRLGPAARRRGVTPRRPHPAVVVGLVRRLRRRRSTAPVLVRDLPDLVDLLSLAVGAGLPLPSALPLISPVAPASLQPGLRDAVEQLAAGRASDDVVHRLGASWGPPAHPLVHALADHLRYGTALLPALERVADEARTNRRRAAETRARKLPVLLLFPLVLCTLPAFGLLTVAPLVAGTFDSLRGGHLEAPASATP
jgi:tight adherence protein C